MLCEMLEHIAPNQTRFVAPGLSPDARGVTHGRYLVVLFASIDQVVRFFRALSEEMSLDELSPALSIMQVRGALGVRELIVQVGISNSYSADQIAAVARLASGLTFTGTSKHFVRYRDQRSPLGYDTDALHGGGGDFVLYADTFVQSYERLADVSLKQMAWSLSLQHSDFDEADGERTCLLRVPIGLWSYVLGYLYRNRVQCEAAACSATSPGNATSPGDERRQVGGERFYLIRVGRLPQRMLPLFCAMPGIEVYRLVLDNVAVEYGYVHPFELSTCASFFEEDAIYLYSGARATMSVIAGGTVFVSSRRLIELPAAQHAIAPESWGSDRTDMLSIAPKLVPADAPTPNAVASFVPLEWAARLKRLLFVLPPAVLRNYQIARTDRGFFLLNQGESDYIPLGDLYYQLGNRLFAPIGLTLVPRIDADLLLEQIGAGVDQICFLRREDSVAVLIERSAMLELGRAALTGVKGHAAVAVPAPLAEQPPTELINRGAGLFPLWGFRENPKNR